MAKLRAQLRPRKDTDRVEELKFSPKLRPGWAGYVASGGRTSVELPGGAQGARRGAGGTIAGPLPSVGGRPSQVVAGRRAADRRRPH